MNDLKVLAIDTSSFPASAAIAEDGVMLGEYVIRNKRKHSQNIMVMVERLFDDLELDISDIDVFAATVGPGSFTGLRIGIATVRAFAQACGKKCVAVNTLEALAYNFVCSGLKVVSMLDARRDEVFAAAYVFMGNEMCEIQEPCVMTVSECLEEFGTEGVIYAGDGALKNADAIRGAGGIIAPCSHSETRAASAAALAMERARNGGAADYGSIKPLYLRKSQAEREYEKKARKSAE